MNIMQYWYYQTFFSMTATATQAWRESYLLWASGTTLTQTSWILWGEMGEDLGYMDSQAKRILFWDIHKS